MTGRALIRLVIACPSGRGIAAAASALLRGTWAGIVGSHQHSTHPRRAVLARADQRHRQDRVLVRDNTTIVL